ADEAARERQPLDRGREVRACRERVPHQREPFGLPRRTRQRDAVLEHPIRADLEPQRLAEAEKGVAGEALRALDAFEQKTRLERRELDERRYRRVEIGRDVERGLHVALVSRSAKTKNPVSDSAETGFALIR